MKEEKLIAETEGMIDSLKTVCRDAGLGNTGGEYHIVTSAFLYKFLNDKFFNDIRLIEPKLQDSKNIEKDLEAYSDNDYKFLLKKLKPDTAKLKRKHFISRLYNQKNEDDFDKKFDAVLIDIADFNIDIFSVKTETEERVRLFNPISPYIPEMGKRLPLCRGLVEKLIEYSFADLFAERYDYFSTIFEYLIKDYNKDFGKYGEYYTPRSIAGIIAKILVPMPVKNVTIYDPAAGTGTLVLSLANQIGEDKSTIYTQDISQKSNEFLRLNLTLNNLVHSLQNVIQGNTLTHPVHLNREKNRIAQFDYVVSNPPFNMDFADTRDELAGDSHKKRFFAGIPNIPPKKIDSMSVYLVFIQHILYSLKADGKAAIVVPTGFLTAQSGIEKRIREYIIQNKMLNGVVSMPSNIFATTGTNVSILFLDGGNTSGKAVLIDASKLGEKKKVEGVQRTFLLPEEQKRIVATFKARENVDDFCAVVSFEEISAKTCSFNAGQYYAVKIEYKKLTNEEFVNGVNGINTRLEEYFSENKQLEKEIRDGIKRLTYERT